MKGATWGPSSRQADIERRLAPPARSSSVLSDADLSRLAQALADEKALGWFQGRMEFGPRALGGRSILGDARSPRCSRC
jgi:carbamoyltransferase